METSTSFVNFGRESGPLGAKGCAATGGCTGIGSIDNSTYNYLQVLVIDKVPSEYTKFGNNYLVITVLLC